MKNVLVVCGNGIASFSIMVAALQDHLDEVGLSANIEKASLMDCTTEKFNSKDLIVSSTALDNPDITTEVVVGVGLLTGIGEEETFEEIDAILSK